MKTLQGRPAGKNIDALSLYNGKTAKIINAMHMIGMAMGIKHAIKVAYVGIQHLLAKIGPGINNQTCCAIGPNSLNCKGTAPTPVFGVLGIAVAPNSANSWNTGRRAATQYGKTQPATHVISAGFGILPNSLKKFSVF